MALLILFVWKIDLNFGGYFRQPCDWIINLARLIFANLNQSHLQIKFIFPWLGDHKSGFGVESANRGRQIIFRNSIRDKRYKWVLAPGIPMTKPLAYVIL